VKLVKKLFSTLLSLLMVATMFSTVMADGTTNITIPDSDEATYNVWQIFTIELNEEDGTIKNAYWGVNGKGSTGSEVDSATRMALNEIAAGTTSNSARLDIIKQYLDETTEPVTVLGGKNKSYAAVDGYYLVEDTSGVTGTKAVVDDNGKPVAATADGELPAGYSADNYVVKDGFVFEKVISYGVDTVVVVPTADTDEDGKIEIAAKRTVPSSDKFVEELGYEAVTVIDTKFENLDGDTNWVKVADHDVNKAFKFKLHAELGNGEDLNAYNPYVLKFIDRFSDGLVFDEILGVQFTLADGTKVEIEPEVDSKVNYTVSHTDATSTSEGVLDIVFSNLLDVVKADGTKVLAPNVITLTEYEALSDEEKANYQPSANAVTAYNNQIADYEEYKTADADRKAELEKKWADAEEKITDTDASLKTIKDGLLAYTVNSDLKNLQIDVIYKAHLDLDAVMKLGTREDGELNKMHIEFSNKPEKDENGNTPTDETSFGKTPDTPTFVFTYEAPHTKTDGSVITQFELNSMDDADEEKAKYLELDVTKKITVDEWKALDADEAATYTEVKEVVDGEEKVTGYETKLYYKPLEGVGFTLSRSNNKPVELVWESEGFYRPASAEEVEAGNYVTEMTTPANGIFDIRGLDEGTYTLKETKTPKGYTAASDMTIVIDGNNLGNTSANQNHVEATMTVNADESSRNVVENYVGISLPETGGIGTTIFYAVGACLVLAAGVYFTVRRRMENE